MKNLQRFGALGALLFAAGLVVTFVLFLIILPSQGVTNTADPAQVLPLAASNSLPLILANSLNVILAVASLLMVAALSARWRAGSPELIDIAATPGLIATTLLVASGSIRVFGLPELGLLYARNQSGASVAFVALNGVANAMGNAAFMAWAVWTLLASWVALQRGELSRPLNSIGLLWGVLVFVVTVFPAVVPVGAGVGVVYFAWLGLALLRQPGTVSARAMSSALALAAHAFRRETKGRFKPAPVENRIDHLQKVLKDPHSVAAQLIIQR